MQTNAALGGCIDPPAQPREPRGSARLVGACRAANKQQKVSFQGEIDFKKHKKGFIYSKLAFKAERKESGLRLGGVEPLKSTPADLCGQPLQLEAVGGLEWQVCLFRCFFVLL